MACRVIEMTIRRVAQIGLAIGSALLAAGASTPTCWAGYFGPSGFLHRVAGTEAASIGVATMGSDGTIELRLRATGPGRMVGEGFLTYPPSDPQYAEILRHLGGLKPGETKSVPPWPDP
jgi:hypothetical protein